VYHLFGLVNKMLGGQKFASDMEVAMGRSSVVCAPTDFVFFASGIHKLVEIWDKCLNKLGGMLKDESTMLQSLHLKF